MQKSKLKRFIASILLMITMISSTTPIFAASGSGKYVGGQYDSGMYTTDNQGSKVGILIRRLINNRTGEKHTVFCAEHGIDFKTGVVYNGQYYTPTNSAMRKACKIAYLGWYKDQGDYVIDGGILAGDMIYVKQAYVFTQQYIWETLGQSNATFINTENQQAYENFKVNINSQLDNFAKRPSFDATTITVQAGESKTITDINGVLANYPAIDRTTNGIRVVHTSGSNQMTITPDENISIENYTIADDEFKSWGMVKNETSDRDSMVYFEFSSGIQDQLYSMAYNDPITLRISLKIDLYGKLELQKLDTTGKLVDGAIYNVSSSNGYNNDVEVKNGKIVVEKLKKGTYTVKEKNAPAGYLLDKKAYNVEVKANEVSTQAIKNTEPTGSVKITKSDIVTGRDNRIDKTSHHGDATMNGATYVLTASEDIYNKSKSLKYFSKNDEIAIAKFNEYGKATISITAKNSNLNLKVENDYITGLPLGKYNWKETNAPIGYKLDTNIYNFEFEYKDQNTNVIKKEINVTEDVQRARFEIIKISSNDNTTANKIANAEFTVILSKYVDYYGSFEEAAKHLNEYAEDEYDILKTDGNGHATSKLLAYGIYEGRETKTPSDEIETVEPFYINIDKNSDGIIKEFVENDLPFTSYLKLVKVDKKTGKNVTFSNTTFSLSKLNENTKQWEKVKCKTGIFSHDKWKTDKNAIAYTETKLEAGTYKADEILTPNGFLELEEPVVFKINRSNKTLEFDEDYDAYITITVGNEQPTGTIKLDKSVAIRQDVDTSLVDISDLSKIKFKLTAKEKIIDYADGSTIYEKGQEVGTYNLTKEGKLEVKKLSMGKYELEEIETLDGLVLDNTKHEIVFKQEDTKTKVYTREEKFVNDTTLVEFSKTDITGDKELEGATLIVTDSNGKVIDKWVSGERIHKIEGLKAGEKYTLKEEIQVDSYVKATDIEFKVENTKEIQKVTMIDKVVDMSKVDIGGNEIEGAKMQVLDHEGNVVDEWVSTKEAHKIKNLEEGKSYILHEEVCVDGFVKATDVEFEVTTDKETQHLEMIDKVVEMSKVDIGGEEIEGATIQVLDEEDNIIDEWVSGKEAHKINGLEEGKSYKLHEEVSSGYFVKATDVKFEVSYDKETQHLEMIDKIVDVTKTDMVNGEEVEGAKLVVTDKEGNEIDKWTSTKEPHHVVGLEEGKTYTLTETICPYGYEVAESITFTVTNDKETQLIEMKDMPILKSVQVEKIDKDTGEHIKSNKFTFGIFEDEECTKLIKEAGANEFEGTALFEDLRYGTFYIKELKAPLGYKLSDQVVKIEINDKGVFADGVSLEETEGIYSFVYYNSLLPAVQTGNETNYALLLGIAAIATLGIIGGTILLKRKKNN